MSAPLEDPRMDQALAASQAAISQAQEATLRAEEASNRAAAAEARHEELLAQMTVQQQTVTDVLAQLQTLSSASMVGGENQKSKEEEDTSGLLVVEEGEVPNEQEQEEIEDRPPQGDGKSPFWRKFLLGE